MAALLIEAHRLGHEVVQHHWRVLRAALRDHDELDGRHVLHGDDEVLRRGGGGVAHLRRGRGARGGVLGSEASVAVRRALVCVGDGGARALTMNCSPALSMVNGDDHIEPSDGRSTRTRSACLHLRAVQWKVCFSPAGSIFAWRGRQPSCMYCMSKGVSLTST